MLPAALLQSENVLHKCWFNQTPAKWELTVCAEGCRRNAVFLHSLSPSLLLTRNHLKLYWLWFASSALFPAVLCLCLGSIITTALCSGSFSLISLPSFALDFFFFPLYCCVLHYLHPFHSSRFASSSPLNIDWGQRSQIIKCLNQVDKEAYISLFLSSGSFRGVQQFFVFFFIMVFINIQKQQTGRFGNLLIPVSAPSEEVLWQRLSKIWCSHENGDGADDVEDAKSHQEEAVYDGCGKLPLLRHAELPVLLLHVFHHELHLCKQSLQLSSDRRGLCETFRGGSVYTAGSRGRFKVEGCLGFQLSVLVELSRSSSLHARSLSSISTTDPSVAHSSAPLRQLQLRCGPEAHVERLLVELGLLTEPWQGLVELTWVSGRCCSAAAAAAAPAGGARRRQVPGVGVCQAIRKTRVVRLSRTLHPQEPRNPLQQN